MANIYDNKMGDPKQTLWQEITQGIGKIMMFLSYIAIGTIAKIAFDSRTNKLTWKQIGIKSALSICAGAIASVMCQKWGFEKWAMLIVPTSTLIGEGLFGYVISHWEAVADKFLAIFVKTNGKK